MANVVALPAVDVRPVEALHYAPPEKHRRHSVLAILANMSGTYPLVLAGLLYGQWVLSWYFLGHIPRSSLDDPKYITGANWMHPLTYMALVASLPAFFVGLGLSVLYLLMIRSRTQPAAIRMTIFTALWISIYTLLNWDPAHVLYWWMD